MVNNAPLTYINMEGFAGSYPSKSLKFFHPFFMLCIILYHRKTVFGQNYYARNTDPENTCENLGANPIGCPSFPTNESNYVYDIGIIQTYLEKCGSTKPPELQKGEIPFSCFFFPVVEVKTEDGNVEKESCHYHTDTINCTHGFMVTGARNRRPKKKKDGGNNFTVSISVAFFGTIQPSPVIISEAYSELLPNLSMLNELYDFCVTNRSQNAQDPTCLDIDNDNLTREVRDVNNKQAALQQLSRFDSTEWLALGISPRDTVMGDDMVLYCHPFMDKRFRNSTFSKMYVPGWINMSSAYYPDDIGIGLNKHDLGITGKITYKAEKHLGSTLGNVSNSNVTFYPNKGPNNWAYLECKADITTYIRLESKSSVFLSPFELDMEKEDLIYLFMAVGPCLDKRCYGNVKENPKHHTVFRTTVMQKHRQVFVAPIPTTLFNNLDQNGGCLVRNDYFHLAISLLFSYLNGYWIDFHNIFETITK